METTGQVAEHMTYDHIISSIKQLDNMGKHKVLQVLLRDYDEVCTDFYCCVKCQNRNTSSLGLSCHYSTCDKCGDDYCQECEPYHMVPYDSEDGHYCNACEQKRKEKIAKRTSPKYES